MLKMTGSGTDVGLHCMLMTQSAFCDIILAMYVYMRRIW